MKGGSRSILQQWLVAQCILSNQMKELFVLGPCIECPGYPGLNHAPSDQKGAGVVLAFRPPHMDSWAAKIRADVCRFFLQTPTRAERNDNLSAAYC